MNTVFRNLCFYTILAGWTALMPLALAFFWVQELARPAAGNADSKPQSPSHPPLHTSCRVSARMAAQMAARRVYHLYGRGWRYCIRPWVQVSYSGPPGGLFPAPCILVANHQSFFDIHCMGQQPHCNIVFTVRSWPFRLPLYGFFMRLARCINVEALDSEATLACMRQEAAQGSVIVFFPEGHRNPAPDRDRAIGRFHAGAFAAALAADLPIVPVVLRGTGTVLPPGAPWIYPGSIDIRVLDPVYPAEFRDQGEGAARALRKKIQAVMRSVIQQSL